MTRKVEGYTAVNTNVRKYGEQDMDDLTFPLTNTAGAGSVPGAVSAQVAAIEYGDGVWHQTLLTLTDLPQAIADASSWQGTEIYDFPEGRVHVLGVVATLAPKTTSAIATTIKSGVGGVVGLGTTAATKIAIDTTMVDLLPSTVTVNSTVINVAAAAVGAVLAAAAAFDGTATAKKMFLNSSVAAVDIDGDATMTWTGTVRITWCNLGDK